MSPFGDMFFARLGLSAQADRQTGGQRPLEPVMNLSPVSRDFVDGGRFNSPRMTLMRRIDTDFLGKSMVSV